MSPVRCVAGAVGLGVLLLSGCTTVWTYAPSAPEGQEAAGGWPLNLVTVTVQDLRPMKDESNEITKAVHEAALGLLSGASTVGGEPHRLGIQILAHRAAFETGNPYWHGATGLRVIVREPGGGIRNEWQILGTSQKWNWWGRWTAVAVSQEAFEAAIKDLRRRMAEHPLIAAQAR